MTITAIDIDEQTTTKQVNVTIQGTCNVHVRIPIVFNDTYVHYKNSATPIILHPLVNYRIVLFVKGCLIYIMLLMGIECIHSWNIKHGPLIICVSDFIGESLAYGIFCED